jgi:hypothetical protein
LLRNKNGGETLIFFFFFKAKSPLGVSYLSLIIINLVNELSINLAIFLAEVFIINGLLSLVNHTSKVQEPY